MGMGSGGGGVLHRHSSASDACCRDVQVGAVKMTKETGDRTAKAGCVEMSGQGVCGVFTVVARAARGGDVRLKLSGRGAGRLSRRVLTVWQLSVATRLLRPLPHLTTAALQPLQPLLLPLATHASRPRDGTHFEQYLVCHRGVCCCFRTTQNAGAHNINTTINTEVPAHSNGTNGVRKPLGRSPLSVHESQKQDWR